MSRNATLDNPPISPDEDEFNRRPFSTRLAETIAGFDAREGAPVFGLFGSWGSGKSTVLNFVQAELEARHGGRVVVFPFNAWLFKDADSLLREFFEGLAHSIGAVGTRDGKLLGELLERYGGALSSIPLVGGSASKLAEGLGKNLARDPTAAMRDRVAAIMRTSERKVIVLIDDLDRVDRDEIMTVLKVVRLSANFPNVIYLLAFDEARVGRVAGQAYGEASDGRQFLEKIVQYPVSLPAIGRPQLAAYVLKHARAAADAAGVVLDEADWAEFRTLCLGPLQAVLRTPRQAIRYANALRFALPMMRGEVDPFDQMVVEAARVLFPDLYAVLRADVSGFADADRVIGRLRETTGRTPVPDEEACEAIVRCLLRGERRSDKPITNPRYHGRAFSYAVATDDVSDRELAKVLALAQAGGPPLDAALEGLAKARMPALVERLGTVAGGLDLVRADHLATALCAFGGLVPPPFANSDAADQLAALVAALATHLSFLRRDRDLHCAPAVVARATPLPFALLVFRKIQPCTDLDEPALRAAFLARVVADAERRPPYAAYRPLDALRLLQFWQGSEPEAQRTWLDARIAAHPDEADAVIALFADPDVTLPWIAELVDPAGLAAAVKRHWGAALTDRGDERPGLAAARAYLDAFARRQNGSRAKC